MSTSAENSTLTRSVIIACVLLTGLFILLFFLEDNFTGLFGKYADEAITGLMLLGLWLVLSSTIRSLSTLAKNIPTWKLLLAGLLIGGISAVLYAAFLLVFPKVSKSGNVMEVGGATGGMILLLGAISFLISLIAVINVRVRNRQLGNVLEFLIIGGAIFAFVYFANR